MALATRGGELRSISWESSVTEDGVSPWWLTSVASVQRTTSLSKIQVNRRKPSENFLNPSESISLTHLKHSCWYPVELLMKWYESCTVQFPSQYTVCVYPENVTESGPRMFLPQRSTMKPMNDDLGVYGWSVPLAIPLVYYQESSPTWL